MRGGYFDLRPWHFKNGASFDIEEFRAFQFSAQHWRDSRWLWLLMLLPPVGLVLYFTVLRPRKAVMTRRGKALGILEELPAAEALCAAGNVAYTPSQEQRDAWADLEEEEDRSLHEDAWRRQSAAKQQKKLLIWGLLLIAVSVILLVFGLSRGFNYGWYLTDQLPILLGAVFFGGAGIYALVRALK